MIPEAPAALTPCCFCGKLGYDGSDPTYVAVGTRAKVTKWWWCHIACFETQLPNLPEPWFVHVYEDNHGHPWGSKVGLDQERDDYRGFCNGLSGMIEDAQMGGYDSDGVALLQEASEYFESHWRTIKHARDQEAERHEGE